MSAPQQAEPQPVTIDAVVALLRNDRMRGFRIDVETDSLVEADQTQEKQDRLEFVGAVGKFLTEFGPVVQQMPPLAPLAAGMLQFAVRSFKAGAELEELIEKTMANVAQVLANPQPPQPSPDEMIKAQTAKDKGQAEIQKANTEAASSLQDAAAKQQSQKLDLIGKVLDHQHATAQHAMNAEQMARQDALAQAQHERDMKEARKPNGDE